MLRRSLGIFLFVLVSLLFSLTPVLAAPSDPLFASWVDNDTITMGGDGIVEAFLDQGGTDSGSTIFTDNAAEYLYEEGKVCYVRLSLTVTNTIPTQGVLRVTTGGVSLGGDIPECGERAKPLRDKWDGKTIGIRNVERSGRKTTQGYMNLTITATVANPKNSEVTSPPAPKELEFKLKSRLGRDLGNYQASFSGGSSDKQKAIYKGSLVLDEGGYTTCTVQGNDCADFEIKSGETSEVAIDTGNAQISISQPDPVECENKAGPLGWIFCELIETGYETALSLYEQFADRMLKTQPINRDTGNGGLYAVWSAFRTIANVGFVIAFMVIIFAQALSLNIEAYAIKKVLPRLVVGAILVQLSFTLSAFLVDVTNIVGKGIFDLINTALSNAGANKFELNIRQALAASGLTVAGTFAGTAVAAAGIAGLISIGPILFLCFLSILAAFVTIVIRNILILVLIVISPLACIAWLLPNTEQYFKSWFSLLFKLLMMYPLINLIVAMGALAAAMVGS